MLMIEGIGQATPADPTVSPGLPHGKFSHGDLRAMLQELRAQTTVIADAMGQTKTALETHSGQTNQGFVAAQQTLAAVQEGLRRIEALIAASL